MKQIKLIKPIFAAKTWGNTQAIVDFIGYDPQFKKTTGEIFLVAGLPDEQGGSTIIDGQTIRDIYADQSKRTEIFGERFADTDEFPFLFKLLAVNKPLSLQVHPEDQKVGNKLIPGKTEGWWAVTDAKVLCGFKKGFSKEDFEQLIADKFFKQEHSVDDLAKFMNIIELKKGEAIYVESGTIHSIIEGILLEPQQPCNTTFRIYDWGRNMTDRPLHLTKALEALNYDSRPKKIPGNDIFFDNRNFNVEYINESTHKDISKAYFHLVLPVGNAITLNDITIPAGQCAFIPANIDSIDINIETGTNVFLINVK